MASRLPRKAAATTIAALVIAAACGQPLARPATSPDDLRAVSALIGSLGHKGDDVVFPDIAKRLIADAYPAGFRNVSDIGLDTAPSARNSLYGLNVPQPTLWRRLAQAHRVWIVIFPVISSPEHYGSPSDPHVFCLRRTWRFPLNEVLLYSRCAS
jgi:hypothetical protein